MIEQRFVQFSKQFTRIENRTFGRASWSVLDDYFLFQNNYNKGKMGYVAVKIWLLPNSSRETHGYTITAVAVSTGNRASPCYATKSLICRNCLMSSFLIFKVLYKVGYTPHSNRKCASPPPFYICSLCRLEAADAMPHHDASTARAFLGLYRQ